jgi:hypothetical protein
MPSILVIDKGQGIKELSIKKYAEDELYKKAGFKSSEHFKCHATWNVEMNGKKYSVCLYGKTEGRANQENKYDFPPPVDNLLFFGSCVLVNKQNDTAVDIKESEWTAIYNHLFGGFEDIGLLMAYATQFVFSYVICGVKYISNLPNCILYYITDALIQMLYLPIRITLWFLYSFLKINLYPTEKKIWGYAQWIDSKIYGSVGFNFLRWPKNIRDQCYNCKRLKTKTVLNKAKEIDYNFKVEIPRMIKKGTDRIKKGGDQIKKAFGV